MDFSFGDGRDWFLKRRFGLFVHWGLYAIDGWHEQMQYRRKVPRAEYRKLAGRFNPVRFDPERWLDLAEAAGMEYIVFTTKHVDGFCLWDTKHTDYNVMRTPYGRDTLRMLADACHRRGFPLLLYHSGIDNHQPNYPNKGLPYELERPDPGDRPDKEKYLAFMKNQVEELCIRYGEIHGFWWDGCNVVGGGYDKLDPDFGKSDPVFNPLIRRLQPNAVINNRGFGPGDYDTPERDWYGYVHELLEFTRPTEACTSIGVESWGYRKDEDYYTVRYLEESIARTLAKGGNFLLNAGPMGDGDFPPEAQDILGRIGGWFHKVKECFHGADPITWILDGDSILVSRDFLLTRKGHDLYVILHHPLKSGRVTLKPIDVLPSRATLLNTGEPVKTGVEMVPSMHRDGKGFLRIHGLPVDGLSDTVPVIKLEFPRFPLSEERIREKKEAYLALRKKAEMKGQVTD